MSKDLDNLTEDMVKLHKCRTKYRNSFYGIGIGFGLYLFGLFGIKESDTAEFVGLSFAGLSALRGYFAYRRAEKLEIKINERLNELKEKGYIKEK